MDIQRKKLRIVELENRLKTPKHWTSGEISIYERQLREENTKLDKLIYTLKTDNN